VPEITGRTGCRARRAEVENAASGGRPEFGRVWPLPIRPGLPVPLVPAAKIIRIVEMDRRNIAVVAEERIVLVVAGANQQRGLVGRRAQDEIIILFADIRVGSYSH